MWKPHTSRKNAESTDMQLVTNGKPQFFVVVQHIWKYSLAYVSQKQLPRSDGKEKQRQRRKMRDGPASYGGGSS